VLAALGVFRLIAGGVSAALQRRVDRGAGLR
jgi:hypothetical protein